MIVGSRPSSYSHPVIPNVQENVKANTASDIDANRRGDGDSPFRATLIALLNEIKRDVNGASPITLIERFQQRFCDLLEDNKKTLPFFSGNLREYFNHSDSHCVALLEPLLRCSPTLIALCRVFLGAGRNCHVVQGEDYAVSTENGISRVTLGLDVQGAWSERIVGGEITSGEQCAVVTLLTLWLSHLTDSEIDPALVMAFLQLIEFEIAPYGLSLEVEVDSLDGLSFDASIAAYTKQQQRCHQNSGAQAQVDRVWLPVENKSVLGLLLELVAHVSELCRPCPKLSPANPADYLDLIRALFGAGSLYGDQSEHKDQRSTMLPMDLGEPFRQVPFRPLFSMSMAGDGCEFQFSKKFIPLDRNSAVELKIHTAPAPWERGNNCRGPVLLTLDGASGPHNGSVENNGSLHIVTAIDRNAFGNNKIAVRFGDTQTAASDNQDLPPLWLKVKSSGADLIVQIGEGVFGSRQILFENKITTVTTSTTVTKPGPAPEKKPTIIVSQHALTNAGPTFPVSSIPANNDNAFRLSKVSSGFFGMIDREFDRAAKGVEATLFSPFWASSQPLGTDVESDPNAIAARKLFRDSYINTFYKLDSLPPRRLTSMAVSADRRYAAILDEVLTDEREDFNALRDQKDLLAPEDILVMYANRIKRTQHQLAEYGVNNAAAAALIEIQEIRLRTFKKRYDSQSQLQGDLAALVAIGRARGEPGQPEVFQPQPLSLAQARVEAMRLYLVSHDVPGPDVVSGRSDHVLLALANDVYDRTSANYSLHVAKRLAELEAINYYFPAKVRQLQLDINDPDLIDKFISAHYAVFDVETVHRFHRKQFETIDLNIPVLRPRGQVGIRRYYEQLNEYLQDHLAGHADSIVQRVSTGISALDLERPYQAVIGLDIIYRDDGVPMRGGMPNIIRRPVTGDNRIYLVKGDSGTIYATSTFGGALVIEEASAFIDPRKFDALARHDITPKMVISIAALANLLWPNNSPLPKNKRLEMLAPRRYALPAGDSPGAFIRSDQRRLLQQYVALFREQNMDREWHEKLASSMPFFDAIQRSMYDPHYSPDFKDLAFDGLDLVITLISIGIPVFKLSSVGLKATQSAIRAARLAGISGAGLRKIVFRAASPYLKKSAFTAAREVAGFILPPIDWGRTLANIGSKIVRHTGAIKHVGGNGNKVKLSQARRLKNRNRRTRLLHQRNRPRTRCTRTVGAVCSQVSGNMLNRRFSYTYSLARDRDMDRWEDTLLQLIEYPGTWEGGKSIVGRQFSKDYKVEFNQKLTVAEQEAVRGWSFVNVQQPYGTSMGDDLVQGYTNNNFYLNKALRGDWPLTPELKAAAINLSSGLKKLTAPSGKTLLIRVSDVDVGYSSKLAVGDTVTSYPTFMAASGSGELLEIALDKESLFGLGTALAVYHIKAKSAKPLIKRTSTQVSIENEWIFDPESFFVVTGISKVRKLINGLPYGKEINVIRLKEIDRPPGIPVAKNIHTGQSVMPTKLLA
ncbi:hypothetical protein [Glaciimonas sp. PAMC28666]|uniref:hypothetical protein n=1 Tax=Glaciimonas sp. PAMC28666 TaxID=2807626 RepID=UPI0019623793|nr:hypothetical protein [Glaciimonas sp. PAMC28666]QRX81393.1 hypothetical protein JQN73_14600 [Glaciimonas sp. PAMC28666]